MPSNKQKRAAKAAARSQSAARFRFTEMKVSAKVGTVCGTGDSGTKNGKAFESTCHYPLGICFVAKWKAVIISDSGNHTLRKWDVKTDQISTFAGIPGTKGKADGAADTATFNYPEGLSFDQSSDSVFVCDNLNHCIRCVRDRVVTTIAGSGARDWKDGIGKNAAFYNPVGIAVNKAGVLFVCDNGNHRIRKLQRQKSDGLWAVSTVAGNGKDEDSDGKALESDCFVREYWRSTLSMNPFC